MKAPDRLLAEVLYRLASFLSNLAGFLMFRRASVGLVYFSWGHRWRRWRVVPRTDTTVPWVEVGPIDIVFKDNYPRGYK